ncbi:erythromycin esterase family protein [Streptomyces sp. 15-116A]|uniref:erythromycin esterase family protein n=1 Tax=Streptomyces sp. 15-116A TaxID=2259035 RepID=UPI0021B4305C|nr:erythromycin esterase family protein [Streptomyces sp. 15-116A]MCT7350764.1 erythromycin esterase family protein [Streptomyces sp. 15-116A]
MRGRMYRVVAAVVTAVAVAVSVPGAATATEPGGRQGDPVAGWARRHAEPLRTPEPGRPLDDLGPLRDAVGRARIVGLGEAVHGAAEVGGLKHRALRLLVERMGFRSLAWEEDWTTGVRIDTYLRTGQGDPDALVRDMGPQWSGSREVADVLRRLRGFNAGRATDDQVRFVGVEFFMTRRLAYDAVTDYVTGTAPEHADELRGLYEDLRPRTDDIWQHISWYQGVKNKRPYVDRARQAHQLVAKIPHTPGDRSHALALHNARQILSFYEFYALGEDEQGTYRDARAAENLRWWHEFTGDKTAYWAASPHTANAPELRLTQPEMSFASAGSHLRGWYGRDYRSVGFTLDHGTVATGAGQPAELPPPAPGWFEKPLGEVRADQFVLNLHGPAAAPPVRAWLHGPVTTRGPGPGSVASGGSLAQWFDVLVHRQEVTPALPLP